MPRRKEIHFAGKLERPNGEHNLPRVFQARENAAARELLKNVGGKISGEEIRHFAKRYGVSPEKVSDALNRLIALKLNRKRRPKN